MSADIYQSISIGAFVLAAVFLIIAIILFLAFDIPSVLGELSGKTAAKQVAEIRAANKNVVAKRRTVSTTNSSATQRSTGKLSQNNTSRIANTNVVDKTDLLVEENVSVSNETELLTDETTLLEPDTTLLSPETTLLSGGTTLLNPETTLLSPEEVVDFEIIQDVVVIHTKEVI